MSKSPETLLAIYKLSLLIIITTKLYNPGDISGNILSINK